MGKRNHTRRVGLSFKKRIIEVNDILDKYSRTGLSNREIWRRYIYPVYGISEKTLYNYVNAYCFLSEEEKQQIRETFQ